MAAQTCSKPAMGFAGMSLYGSFLEQASTGKVESKETFHLRYKERGGLGAV